MASKRPSKAERQRRNRAQREARQARSAHAGEATSMARDNEDAADADAAATEGSERAAKPRRSARPSAPGTTVPGQRAVLLSFLFSIMSVALLVLLPISVQREVPVDDERVAEQEVEVEEGDETATIVEDVKLLEEESLPLALLVMLIPVGITGAAVWATKQERRSTIWTFCMLGLAGYVFFIAGPYGLFTLAPLVALGVGGFQARRDESKERMAELRAQREARKKDKARGKDHGDVIDVDAVEDDED